MVKLTREAYGPLGDARRHLPLAPLRAGLDAVPKPPCTVGRVVMLVARQADGSRQGLARSPLACDGGMPGDGWSRRPPRDPEAQLAVMNAGIAALIANGQGLELFGDNLFVNLASDADHLPAGTRLRVGSADVEVTPKPHNGCAKFLERFGADALRFVQDSRTRDRTLRGVYWRVVADGEVWRDAAMTVVRRR